MVTRVSLVLSISCIIKTRKNGGVEWDKTHGGPYMEMADDIARIE